jgi:hypothetical protein
LKATEKYRMGVKKEGRAMEGVEQTKVILTYRRDTLRNPLEDSFKYS